jgi:hypothetical protein
MCHIRDGMTMSLYGMIIIRMRVIPHEKSPFLLLFNEVRTEIDGNFILPAATMEALS